jgi:hypothetical protein
LSSDNWPDIDVANWAATKRSLHLYTQMLGKIRVALSPPQPNWMFTRLVFTARGLTTGVIPFDGITLEVTLDVFASQIQVRTNRGAQQDIDLVPARTVADVYHALNQALKNVGVPHVISPIPQEVPDTTPFPDDTREASYDPGEVQRWFRAASSAAAVFERWRSHFFGRSGIQLWWGAFDVALILFNGRHASPPTDRGYLMKYDLDAELMNAGLYFGDAHTPPFFYGYIFPQPAGAPAMSIAPAQASWSSALGEWVLPYDAVRTAQDPDAMIQAFLDSIYGHCLTKCGWERADCSYDPPKKPSNASGGS